MAREELEYEVDVTPGRIDRYAPASASRFAHGSVLLMAERVRDAGGQAVRARAALRRQTRGPRLVEVRGAR
eukprot:5615621-Pyramimonas_sp.AAC.1